MTKQEQQKLIEELKDDVFELRQELLFKNERIKKLKDKVETFETKFSNAFTLAILNTLKEQLKEC